MKYRLRPKMNIRQGRAPQGARGLKLCCTPLRGGLLVSRPARGVWVEISPSTAPRPHTSVAPRKGRVG